MAVERARAELGGTGSIRDLPGAEEALNRPLAFNEAVARIAGNHDDVAAAIRRLELAARKPVAAWPDLVCRGLPARPSHLDTSLWFGSGRLALLGVLSAGNAMPET